MRIITSLMILLLFVAPVTAGVGPRHYETTGGFSFCAPEGWVFQNFPGMKFQIAMGPVTGTFRPNINVVDESFAGPLDAYAEANLNSMAAVLPHFKLLGRRTLVTDSGQEGVLLVANNRQHGNLLRQFFLLIKGRGHTCLVATCTCLETDGDRFRPLFLESLRTFQTER